MFSLQSKTRGEQTSFIDEMISNQKVAEAYSMNEENKARFDKINDDLAKYSLKATFFSSITNPQQDLSTVSFMPQLLFLAQLWL